MKVKDKDKLTIKKIAPYLPYGLTAFDTMEENELIIMYDSNTWNTKVVGLNVLISRCDLIKPILRPLSDITCDIEVDKVLMEIFQESWMVGNILIEQDENGFHIIDRESDGQDILISVDKPHTNMWWVTQILIENKYDVFGLISKGIAIDIKQIKNK